MEYWRSRPDQSRADRHVLNYFVGDKYRMPGCPKKMHMMPDGKCMKDADMMKKKKASKKMPEKVKMMLRGLKKRK
jgi:hypothetical protein